MGPAFREHLFPPGHPRLKGLGRHDAYTPNGNDYGAEFVRRALGEPHLPDGPA